MPFMITLFIYDRMKCSRLDFVESAFNCFFYMLWLPYNELRNEFCYQFAEIVTSKLQIMFKLHMLQFVAQSLTKLSDN